MPQAADSGLDFLRGPLLVGGIVGALALGWVASGKGIPGQPETDAPPAQAAACEQTTRVNVAVAPASYDPVVAALEQAPRDCVDVEATKQSATEVAAAYAAGNAPDVWVSDSTYWYSRAFLHQAPHLTVIANDVARTPVLLVGGERATQYPTWSAAETSGWVSTSDPTTTAAATMALAAPVAEAAALGKPPEPAKQVIVPCAQLYGGRRARGLDKEVTLTSMKPTSRRLQVATEQELEAATQSRPFLRSLTPPTGSPTVRFSVAIANGRPEAVQQSARDLVKQLSSVAGLRALHGAGLRAGGTNTATNADQATAPMPDPDSKVVAALLDTWRVVSTPSSMLAVVDVSGSMDFAAGTSTRMGLLAQSASVGINLLPRNARVGLWVFSVNRGGPDQDWMPLEPIERLDKLDHGRTQRYALQERITQLPSLTDGGTGLYDTALAAYK